MRPYLLAKTYAWRGMLLPKSFIQELSSSKNLVEYVDALKATPYSHEVQEITPDITALKVEHAIHRRLVKTHYRLMSIYKENQVLSALYSRHVARDFKTILRGLYAGIRGEELANLVDPYAEELIGVRDVVARLLAADDVDEAISTMRLYMGEEAIPPIFEKTPDIAALEVEVDRWTVLRLRTGLKKTPRSWRQGLKKLLEPLFHKFVLTSILRAKIWDLETRKTQQMVEGVIDESFKPIASALIEAKSYDDVKRALTVMPKGSLPPIGESASISGLVTALEKGYRAMLAARASRCFLKPFDEASLALAIILLLEEEVAQLVALAAGIEQGLSQRELLDSLTLPA